MSKSIKFKDGNYMDTHGIVHKKQLLSDMIDSRNGGSNGGLAVKYQLNDKDFNDLASYGTGLYLMFGNCLNNPNGTALNTVHWGVIQISLGSSYCIQVAFALNNTDNWLSMRRQINKKWLNWVHVNLS